MKSILRFTALFYICFLLLAPIKVKSQGDFMDLLLLFVDEKYDVCFHKSLKYNEKEKTKKHPLPYLYAAMASFEMSQDHKYTNMYPIILTFFPVHLRVLHFNLIDLFLYKRKNLACEYDSSRWCYSNQLFSTLYELLQHVYHMYITARR